MKKTILLSFLFLIGCTSLLGKPPLMVSSYFVYNKDCPHICWLGINPGLTTKESAQKLLKESNQISQISVWDPPYNGISVQWNTGDPNRLTSRVGISFENNLVHKISFSPFPFTIGEFVDAMGNPDEISITQDMVADDDFTVYITYFLSIRTVLYIDAPINDQPSPNDIIDILIMNIDPDNQEVPKWLSDHQNLRQPWLGFGHLEEYLKNRPPTH